MNNEPRDLPIQMNQGALPPAVGLSGFELDMYRVQRNLYPAAGGGGSEEPPSSFSLRDLLTPLFRHKFKVLFIFLFFALLSFAYVASVPNTYRSTAQLTLSERIMNMVVDPTGEGGTFFQPERSHSSNSRVEVAILQSTNLAEKVVDRIGVNRLRFQLSPDPDASAAAAAARPAQAEVNYAELNWFGKSLYWLSTASSNVVEALNLEPPELTPREKALARFQNNLSVRQPQPNGPLLEVSFTALNPELAQDVLSTLLEVYKEYHIEMQRIADPETFESLLEESRQSLREKEEALASERERLNIVSLDAQKELLVTQLADLRAKLDEAHRMKKEASIRVGALQRTLDRESDPDDLQIIQTDDPRVNILRSKIAELEIQRVEMGKYYKSESKGMRDLQDRIDEYKSMLTDAVSAQAVQYSDPVRRQQEMELASNQVEITVNEAHEEALTAAIDEAENELAFLMKNETEIQQMEQEVHLERIAMDANRTSLQVARHAAMFEKDQISNVVVTDAASMPKPAKSPKKMVAILFLGTFAGLFFGMGLAFALDFMNHSVRTNEDVEKWLGLPVLAGIPKNRRHLPLMREEIL